MNIRQNLRQIMKEKRAALSQTTHAEFSAAIVKHLRHSLKMLALKKSVGFCMPIQNEPNILPFILESQKKGIVTAMAKVLAKNAPLIFVPWKDGEPLEPDACGIPAPILNEKILPEILLIPLLAFDENGFRLGYGGGYFDRTLAENDFYSVGIGFEMNRVDSVFPQSYDQPLNAVVTENGFFEFPR